MDLEKTLSRRDAIKLGGAAIFALSGCGSTTPLSAMKTKTKAAAANAETCNKATNVTRGPYFIDKKNDPNISGDQVDPKIPMRSDIRSDTEGGTEVQAGLPLALKIVIGAYSSNGTCSPISNAQVDIWHCNAQGVYSDVQPGGGPSGSGTPPSGSPTPPSSTPSPPPATTPAESTVGQNFLRGYQITDATGAVNFQTIFPGWYNGRAVHIHFKIRVFDSSGNVTTEATTQLFFDDSVTNVIFLSNAAYQRSGMRDTLNSGDMIYSSENPPLIANLIGAATTGYTATLNLGIEVGTIFGG